MSNDLYRTILGVDSDYKFDLDTDSIKLSSSDSLDPVLKQVASDEDVMADTNLIDFNEPRTQSPVDLMIKAMDVGQIKRLGGRVEKLEDGVKIVFKSKAITASKVVSWLNKLTDDEVEVIYSDELEDNDLINKPDKPIWMVSSQNGAFIIKRLK